MKFSTSKKQTKNNNSLFFIFYQHYVDLNEPYLRVNTEYMKRSQTDYLSLMGSPDEMAPPPPRYVNGHILPEIRKYSKVLEIH